MLFARKNCFFFLQNLFFASLSYSLSLTHFYGFDEGSFGESVYDGNSNNFLYSLHSFPFQWKCLCAKICTKKDESNCVEKSETIKWVFLFCNENWSRVDFSTVMATTKKNLNFIPSLSKWVIEYCFVAYLFCFFLLKTENLNIKVERKIIIFCSRVRKCKSIVQKFIEFFFSSFRSKKVFWDPFNFQKHIKVPSILNTIFWGLFKKK